MTKYHACHSPTNTVQLTQADSGCLWARAKKGHQLHAIGHHCGERPTRLHSRPLDMANFGPHISFRGQGTLQRLYMTQGIPSVASQRHNTDFQMDGSNG